MKSIQQILTVVTVLPVLVFQIKEGHLKIAYPTLCKKNTKNIK